MGDLLFLLRTKIYIDVLSETIKNVNEDRFIFRMLALSS